MATTTQGSAQTGQSPPAQGCPGSKPSLTEPDLSSEPGQKPHHVFITWTAKAGCSPRRHKPFHLGLPWLLLCLHHAQLRLVSTNQV